MPADVSELRKLAAELRAASGKAENLAGQVVVKTLADIERDAKIMAPVDTGALRNSISYDVAPDRLSGEVGPTVDYGRHLEWGTSRMAPQPYMNPAADRHIPQFEKALELIAERLL